MWTASRIIEKYISFLEKRHHKRIPNSPLIPENDPTTLFTSSGMQPLVPYLLGEPHPQGQRLVNVQNCFRAQDIDEVGDNRHITFFRMLGNWSLGDYFKKEQLPMFFEFLTKELQIPADRLYVSVFEGLPAGRQGFDNIPRDEESADIWKELFTNAGIDPKDRIFYYGAEKNWWSRAGIPQNMPAGEPGGPDSEVFFDFGKELTIHENSKYKNQKCHPNCDCGRFLEIGNSVFMQYQKKHNGAFTQLPQKNVDFGGGLERLLAATEDKPNIFQTSLFAPIIKTIEKQSAKEYQSHAQAIRLITDHLIASCFIIAEKIKPSNKEQGYVLRRLLRRAIDSAEELGRPDFCTIIETIVEQYKNTDPHLVCHYENIKYTVVEEENTYRDTLRRAHKFIEKKYCLKQDAFTLYATHGLSPTQIKSLGYEFDKQEFAEKMKQHQLLSRQGAFQKFAGGLSDQQEKTIMGHTATHLLHQALRDVLGNNIHQAGSNITAERIRFDFNFDRKLTDAEIKKIENTVNEKIKENLPVRFEAMNAEDAKKTGAIGLFGKKYQEKVRVYLIGDYSKEICGGPHVDFTGKLKRFNIIKQENIGHGQRRIYAVVSVE